MDLFRENSKLKYIVVTCIDGTQEYRQNCKKIKNNYYRINEHVFYIDSEKTWFRVESEKIRCINGKWELKPNVCK